MSRNLRNISTEELEKELAQRKEKASLKDQIKPVAFNQARHEKFVSQIEGVVQDQISGNDKDSEHWCYEAALMYVFGDDIFTKLNKFL